MLKEMRLRLHGKTVAIVTTEAIVWYVYNKDTPESVLDEKYDYMQFSVAPDSIKLTKNWFVQNY